MEIKARPNVEKVELYSPGKPIEEVQRELGLSKIIKLASNENTWGPSPKALEAARQALKEVYLYPDANAYTLKSLIGGELGFEIGQIITGNGSEEIIHMIAKAFVNPGDEVIMAAPSFPRYKDVTRLADGVPVEMPLQDFTHNLEEMVKAISDKTKVIFVCNPNNPTGTIVSEQELDDFMNKVPEGILVVFDEAYFEYVADKNYASGLKYLRAGRPVLVLRTFAKAFGLAGLRMGFGIGTEQIIGVLTRVKEPFNSNLIAQAAAVAAWQDKEYLGQVVANNARGMEQVLSGLKELGCSAVPAHTNFLLADTGKPSPDVFQALMREGIIVRPGHLFGYPTAMRVTIGTPEQNEAFLAALARVLGK